MPATEPRTSGASDPGRPLIQLPPSTRNRMATHTYIVPSVATIGGTRSRLQSSPLTKPRQPPTTSASGIKANAGAPACHARPTTTAVTAMIPPTPTSIPPMQITTVMPALMIASSTALRSTVTRLAAVRKTGDAAANAAPTTKMARTSANSRRAVGLRRRRRKMTSKPAAGLEVKTIDVLLGEHRRRAKQQQLLASHVGRRRR